eukprot:4990317-Lingulodinium_polyedra.AAC.1
MLPSAPSSPGPSRPLSYVTLTSLPRALALRMRKALPWRRLPVPINPWHRSVQPNRLGQPPPAPG